MWVCGCVGVWVCRCVGVWVGGWVGVHSFTIDTAVLLQLLLRTAPSEANENDGKV